MKVQPATFECKKCGTTIEGQLLVECSVNLWAAALKEIRCPKGCNRKNIMLVQTGEVEDGNATSSAK